MGLVQRDFEVAAAALLFAGHDGERSRPHHRNSSVDSDPDLVSSSFALS